MTDEEIGDGDGGERRRPRGGNDEPGDPRVEWAVKLLRQDTAAEDEQRPSIELVEEEMRHHDERRQ